MQFSQSRVSSRGPLIAVIKIEIDPNRSDRIFMHQNDDDYRLAEEFADKHSLSSSIVPHIHDRIRLSRIAILQSSKVEQKKVQSGRSFDGSNSDLPNRLSLKKKPIQQKCFIEVQEEEQQNSVSHETSSGSDNFTDLRARIEQIRKNAADYPNLFASNAKQYVPENVVNVNYESRHKDSTRLWTPSKAQHAKSMSIIPNSYADQQRTHKAGNAGKQYRVQNEDRVSNERVQQRDQGMQAGLNKSVKDVKNNQNNYIKQQSVKRREPKNSPIDQIIRNHSVSQQEPIAQQTVTKGSGVQPNLQAASRVSEQVAPPRVRIYTKEELMKIRGETRNSLSKSDITRINKEVTARLYDQAQIKKNYLKLLKERAEREKLKQDDAELTYRPEINPVSTMIAEGRHRDIPLERHLLEEGRKIQLKRQRSAVSMLKKQVEGCTFQPMINMISRKLSSDPSRLSVVDYQQHCKKRHDVVQLPFKPTVNEFSSELMKQKGSFQERQREFLENKNCKLVQLLKEKREKETIDPCSGQQLFKPKITEHTREPQGLNIGNYLYELSKQPAAAVPPPEPFTMNPSSKAIVQQLYFKRIAWIFAELDGDQDGIISPKKISLQGISTELLDIIKPVLFQMEQLQTELNLQQFRNAIQNLHKKLTTLDKSILYNYSSRVN